MRDYLEADGIRYRVDAFPITGAVSLEQGRHGDAYRSGVPADCCVNLRNASDAAAYFGIVGGPAALLPVQQAGDTGRGHCQRPFVAGVCHCGAFLFRHGDGVRADGDHGGIPDEKRAERRRGAGIRPDKGEIE